MIDIIGLIHDYDPSDPEVEATVRPGWHVNVTPAYMADRPELEPFEVEPQPGRRVFAGEPEDTVALTFEDEATGRVYFPAPEPEVDIPEPAITPEMRAAEVERLCAAVDAERDRRLAQDFAYDFGATLALDDTGAEISAGVRLLQMRPSDRANWQTLQGAALTAVVSGQPDAILPMRAEDNWNIQTTAAQALHVLAAMTAHGSALLFAGGVIKSAVRAADDPAAVDILAGWPD
jgi:hypothetical protein